MRPLIVLGASARAAAFSALRAGFAPLAIDLFADRDLAAACPTIKIRQYPGEFLRALATAPAAPWLYTGGLENHPQLVDRLAEIRPLLGNAGGVLRRVRSPRPLAAAVAAAGLPFPAIAAALTESQLENRWLMKPWRSGGGLGIRFATAEDVPRPPRWAYFQQHIVGEAASAVFVAAGGRAALLGGTRQLLGRDFSLDREFLYAGSIGPLIWSNAERLQLESLGAALTQEFGLTGLFNVDFIRTPKALWPVEVNPRYSASIEILERAWGIDSIRMHVAACKQSAVTPTQAAARPASQQVFGKAIVYAQRDSVVSPRFDALVEPWNSPYAWPLIADLPRVGDNIRTGQPIATVFAEDSAADEVEQILRGRIGTVLFTLDPLSPDS